MLQTRQSRAQNITLGITLGDVNGIGPEVALKAAYAKKWPARLKLMLIGSNAVVEKECRALKLPLPPRWGTHKKTQAQVMLWDPESVSAPRLRRGAVHADAGKAAADWVRLAVQTSMRGCMQGLVTAPLSKEGLKKGKINFPGHTEMLADLSNTKKYGMLLMGEGLRVVIATRHIPLKDVPEAITARSVREAVELLHDALPSLGCKKARIAVCGLNPHAGEGGTMGREEINVIGPAVRRLQKKGYNVFGPLPGDTVFHRAVSGEFDGVVAMYHDQGLAPLKLHAFDSGVNVTLGLPFVRTSPDHGTAYGLAGKKKASPNSMIAAIEAAYQLARSRT